MGKHRARKQEQEQEAQGGYEQQPEYEQQPQYAPQPAPAAPPPSSGGMSEDVVERLRQLGELHEQGVLTDEEFSREKSKLLA